MADEAFSRGAPASGAPAAASGAPAAGVQADVLREINSLWREIDEAYHGVCVAFGLSDGTFDVMYAVGLLGEGCLQRDICAQMCLGKQTVNSSVHKLAAQGHLVLERAPRGRGTRVFLTDTGRELVGRCIVPVMRAEVDAMDALDEQDRETLYRVAGSYVSDLRKRFCGVIDAALEPTPAPAPAR